MLKNAAKVWNANSQTIERDKSHMITIIQKNKKKGK